jgi:hypothetical protein
VAKRFRQFKRVNLTAKTAELIREGLVDKTFKDHFVKKKCALDMAGMAVCRHERSGSLMVARLVESGIHVGKKRGYLDIQCPYATNDPDDYIAILDVMVQRIRSFAEVAKKQTRVAMERAANEIDHYAHRNAMEVLAEAVVDVD